LQRITFVVKSATTNFPLERFIFDVDYMDLSMFPSEAEKDSSTLLRAPTRRQMKLNFQAFLTRLAALETGLTDNDPSEGELCLPAAFRKYTDSVMHKQT
jgi:hypothetical protein